MHEIGRMMGCMGTKPITDEHRITDKDRIRFLSKHGPEGFAGIEPDVNDLEIQVMLEYGRDEPNEDDRLDAFRMLVDMALELEMRKPHIDRLKALDKPTYERMCLVCIGQVPSKVEDLNNADLLLLSGVAERVGKKP